MYFYKNVLTTSVRVLIVNGSNASPAASLNATIGLIGLAEELNECVFSKSVNILINSSDAVLLDPPAQHKKNTH